MVGRSVRWVLIAGLLLSATGCGEAEPAPDPGPDPGPTPAGGSPSPAGAAPGCVDVEPAAGPDEDAAPTQPALRDELLDLRDADQAERTGQVAGNSDAARTDRLREIIEEHGWPTRTMVGADGASAAWLLAQHSDFDVDFQAEALAMMCAALAAGEADPVDVAYLTDRVAVNQDRPQVYGTQVGSCEAGRAVPAPIADEDTVDERRERVGLEPLADYLALFDADCPAGDD